MSVTLGTTGRMPRYHHPSVRLRRRRGNGGRRRSVRPSDR